MEIKKIAIVGANGRLGMALTKRYLRSHEVLAIGRKELDLNDIGSIKAFIENNHFDLLILTAAMTAVDACEAHPNDAFLINAEAAGLIAQGCAEKQIRMIFVSTDYVFDGEKMDMYRESDCVNPISVYGATKLKGEELVLEASDLNLVARVSWVFGPDVPAFPEWIVRQACLQSELTLPAEKSACPTYTVDFAELLEPILFDRSVTGRLHLSNSEACTWLEWGQYCLDVAKSTGIDLKANRIAASTLASISSFVAKRPVNSSMSNEKYTALTGIAPRSWKLAVEDHIRSASFKKSINL